MTKNVSVTASSLLRALPERSVLGEMAYTNCSKAAPAALLLPEEDPLFYDYSNLSIGYQTLLSSTYVTPAIVLDKTEILLHPVSASSELLPMSRRFVNEQTDRSMLFAYWKRSKAELNSNPQWDFYPKRLKRKLGCIEDAPRHEASCAVLFPFPKSSATTGKMWKANNFISIRKLWCQAQGLESYPIKDNIRRGSDRTG